MADTEHNFQLAKSFHEARKFSEAEALYRQVLNQSPDDGPTLHNLGVLAYQTGREEEAYALLTRAIALTDEAPGYYYHHLAEAAQSLSRFDEAAASCRRSLALDPENIEPHINLAVLLLLRGDWPAGFAEYEWRWRSRAFDTRPIAFSRPLWAGEDLAGRRLLIWAEQGLGDFIMLARYVPILVERGAKVIVGCQPPLQRILQTVPGVSHVALGLEDTPPFDVQIPLFGLALRLGITPQTIPAPIPYIRARPNLVETFRRQIRSAGRRLNVGLVWSGSPMHKSDRQRSIALSEFVSLGSARDAAFFSLQTGAAAAQAASPPAELELIDWTGQLSDLADTAALIEALDLVITVDTAVAHLAGALGKPVWNLLAHVPDWRWLLDRSDTPWYPSMRLFRQPRPGDWKAVVKNVTAELMKF